MQQVNLYQPILRKQEKVFSAKTLLQGNLMVLAGLLLLYGYTTLQTSNMHEQLARIQQQRDSQSRLLVELVNQYPAKQRDEGLKGRIDQAQSELQQRRQVLGAVEQLGLDEGGGFSAHLAGLARQDLPRLWLRHIYLQHGQQVELEGSAYQAEEVPLYLQQLSEEAPFNGTAFHGVIIARSEKRAGQFDFTLTTRALEKKP